MVSGGRRPGAGRPAKPVEEKREQLSISVDQKTKRWMRERAKEQGVTMGRILEILIDSYEDFCKSE